MIQILYTTFQKRLSTDQYNAYLDILPHDLKSRAHRYLRWQDAHAFLLGKLLLIKGLERFGEDGKALIKHLKYTKYNRPYLPGKIDFNISHSGEYVVCALSDQCRLGLDIEKIQPRTLTSFRSQMTDDEWETVVSATNPQRAFLNYWTKKEAAIKAHGHGMSLGLKEVVIGKGEMIMEGIAWPLYEVDVAPEYICHLVTDKPVPEAMINVSAKRIG